MTCPVVKEDFRYFNYKAAIQQCKKQTKKPQQPQFQVKVLHTNLYLNERTEVAYQQHHFLPVKQEKNSFCSTVADAERAAATLHRGAQFSRKHCIYELLIHFNVQFIYL